MNFRKNFMFPKLKVLKFNSIQDGQLIWDGSYCETVSVEAKCSIVFKIHLNEHENKLLSFIATSDLSQAIDLLKSVYENDKSIELPRVSSPYAKSVMEKFLIANLIINKDDDDGKKPCKVCNKVIMLRKMRLHVAKHYFKNETSPQMCGFCGINCNSVLGLKTSGSGKNVAFKTKSNCAYAYSFNYASVEKPSKSMPCSNRPIKCPQCEHFFWSYNLSNHYNDKHLGINCPITVTEEEKIAILKLNC